MKLSYFGGFCSLLTAIFSDFLLSNSRPIAPFSFSALFNHVVLFDFDFHGNKRITLKVILINLGYSEYQIYN